MKTSLQMNIFSTCRLFSRYGTMTSPYFLTRNNELSKDSLHPEQSLIRNSAFSQKFCIYLEILRTATDISLFALRRHYYLALILFTRNVENIVIVYTWRYCFTKFCGSYTFYKERKKYCCCYKKLRKIIVVYAQRKYFVQRSVAFILFVRNIENIVVVIRIVESVLVVYTNHKYFAQCSVALILFIRKVEIFAVVYTQHKSFIEIYVAFIVCITNVENIIAIYQKCKPFVRSKKHFTLPALVEYICNLLYKKFLFG